MTNSSETLYLLSALSQKETTLDELTKLIESHQAQIKKAENLGLRQLATPVNKQHELLLLCVFFTAVGSAVQELEKELHHEENVERFILTTWKGDIDAPERKSTRQTTKIKEVEKEAVNV